MKKNKNYIPGAEAVLLVWLLNFVTKIGGYASTLGLTPAEVTSVTNDYTYFKFVENMLTSYKTMVQNIVAYKNLLMYLTSGQVLGGIPVMPDLGTVPPAVPSGFMNRLFQLVQKIKASPNYTTAIGEDLGIIAPNSPVDIDTLQPLLKVTKDAGKPRIKSKKGVAEGMDLYVDRNDGKGFVFLIRLLKLNYVDTFVLPLVITEWNYKGMYVINNSNVGLMSAVVAVDVKKIVE